MASACINNIGVSSENFSPPTYPSFGWLSSRISFSREDDHPSSSFKSTDTGKDDTPAATDTLPETDTQDNPIDFEFRPDGSVITMLPADELFSDGKLMPLHVTTTTKPTITEIKSSETVKTHRSSETKFTGGNVADQCLFSPKAPRCSSRWKEILGFKKLYQASSNPKPETHKSTSTSSTSLASTNTKTYKNFINKTSKSCNYVSLSSPTSIDHTLNQPLLKDSDCESILISSSRLSLSSSSSYEHDDLPRLSLDSDKPTSNLPALQNGPNPFVTNRTANIPTNQNQPRMRLVKAREETSRAISADSPRMNSSGKIVFQNLERSSSSPSSFNGGPRMKYKGVERSYSANVRVAPVLNVPVCSLRGSLKSSSVFGFGPLFSSQPQMRESQNGNRRTRD